MTVRTETEHRAPYSGRLELTWTNKPLALLAHEDGAYEWTPPSDYRIAEVRLLHDVITVGATNPEIARVKDNLLIRGDALNALTALGRLREFSREYLGKVKLCYIDPPFNTKQSFLQYDDSLEHSVWLTMMRDRLLQIKDLLAPEGSVWLHVDDSEGHRARCVLDEVFGPDNFVATFIWRKVDSPNDNKVAVTSDHEYIFCYAKSKSQLRFRQMPDPSILEAYGSISPEGQRYRDRLLKKNGKNSLRTDRPTMFYPIEDPDGNEVYPIHDDGREACWSLGKATVQALQANDKLIWKRRVINDREQWVPYTREWAPETPTRPWPTMWTDVDTTRQAKAHLRELFPGLTPFDTPKPEKLIRRILEIGTDPWDVVLDCFVGSGTTAAVAHKMGRRWVAVERSLDTIATYALPRLTAVVKGEDPGGVTEVLTWEGGGGFRILDVAPSMFEADEGIVVLADWATKGALAEATAAQMGFDYEPVAPFCGRKGRTRLAVVDGLINEAVVRLLVQALDDDERLVLCGTAIDTEAREIIRTLRPGSAIRRIPGAILDDYRARARAEHRLIEDDVVDELGAGSNDADGNTAEGGR